MGHVSQALMKHSVETARPAVSVEAPIQLPDPPARPGAQERQANTPRPAPAPGTARSYAVSGYPGDPIVTNGYSPVLVAHHDCSHPISEQYRSLRTHLVACYDGKPFTLMVTSSQAGEGKTVTCLNLAFVLGRQRDCRTVVVDADLRRGKVGRLLRQQRPVGLADVLRGEATLQEVICPTVYPSISVICAGSCSGAEAGELVGRSELSEVLHQLQKQNDFVLVDTPPVRPVSDTCIIGQVVNDALMVVRMNKTPQEAVDASIKQLTSLNVRVMGMVLTHQKGSTSHYRYWNPERL